MTVRPIIFSAPMVRALLDGRKTQTRRLATSPLAKCKPGDLLWARETWDDEHPISIPDGRFSLPSLSGIPGPPPVDYRVIFRADGEKLPHWHMIGFPYRTLEAEDEIEKKYFPNGLNAGWNSPIHMPRRASRIVLQAQQLQEISEGDADAEGCARSQAGYFCGRPHPAHGFAKQWNTAPEAFADLWKWLHGDESWDANPEVIALTFIARKQNIDDFLHARESPPPAGHGAGEKVRQSCAAAEAAQPRKETGPDLRERDGRSAAPGPPE